MNEKKEHLKKMIELRKDGNNDVYGLACKWCFQDTCAGCPYDESVPCQSVIIDQLIDEIIGIKESDAKVVHCLNSTINYLRVKEILNKENAMEKQPTNLEHYFEKSFSTNGKEVALQFVDEELASEFFDKFDVRKWSTKTLLEPYDCKRRYQMSRLCYEVIDKWVKENCDNEHDKTATFEETSLYPILVLLFKDDEANIIRWRDQNVTAQELRDNAEIVI